MFEFVAESSQFVGALGKIVSFVIKDSELNRGSFSSMEVDANSSVVAFEVVSDIGCARTSCPVSDVSGDIETLYLAPASISTLIVGTGAEFVHISYDASKERPLQVSPYENGKKKRRKSSSIAITDPTLVAKLDNYTYSAGESTPLVMSGVDFNEAITEAGRALTADTKKIVTGIHIAAKSDSTLLTFTATNGGTRIIQTDIALGKVSENAFVTRLDEKVIKALSESFTNNTLHIGEGQNRDTHIIVKNDDDKTVAEYFIESFLEEGDNSTQYPEATLSKQIDKFLSLESSKVVVERGEFTKALSGISSIGATDSFWRTSKRITITASPDKGLILLELSGSVEYVDEISLHPDSGKENLKFVMQYDEAKDIIASRKDEQMEFNVAFVQGLPKALTIEDGSYRAIVGIEGKQI